MLDLNQHLSPNFTLGEMLFTLHRGIDNTPPPEVYERLTRLCTTYLEPVRAKFGPLFVTSGYRSPALNKAIKSASKDSAHLYGCAADFVPLTRGITIAQIVRWIKDESELTFDQVIDESAGPTSFWVHLGMIRPNHEVEPRKEALVWRGGPKYIDFDTFYAK